MTDDRVQTPMAAVDAAEWLASIPVEDVAWVQGAAFVMMAESQGVSEAELYAEFAWRASTDPDCNRGSGFTTATAQRSRQATALACTDELATEVDVLRVRVGVLEGALRDADTALAMTQLGCECDLGAPCYCMEYPTADQVAEARRIIGAVLAGGEAAGQGEEES